jgi:hypothetical protein
MIGLLVDNGLEKMWKEAVVVYFKALYRNFTEATEKNHKKS